MYTNPAIEKIYTDYYARLEAIKNPPVVADPNDVAPNPRDVRLFGQSSTDVLSDTIQTARAVGELTKGKTRLNIVSALTKNDRADFFSFKTSQTGYVGISITTDETIRVQLIDKAGRIKADSEAKSGDLKDNFEKLGLRELELDKGQYFIKVTRATGDPITNTPNYAIQLTASNYFTQDYDTTETPAPNQYAYAASASTQSSSLVSQTLNFLNPGGLYDILS